MEKLELPKNLFDQDKSKEENDVSMVTLMREYLTLRDMVVNLSKMNALSLEFYRNTYERLSDDVYDINKRLKFLEDQHLPF